MSVARRSGLIARFRHVGGTLISREIGVLTNAIAFNFLLCLFPLLLVLAAASQQLPPGRRISGALAHLLAELIPFEHETLARALAALAQQSRRIEAVSLLLILWGSSGIFVPIEMALGRAWGGAPRRSFWRARLLAFVMTLACGTLALVSVGLTFAARSFRDEWPTVAEYGARGSAFLLTLALFFLIYRFVPSTRIQAGMAARAALYGGAGWELIKYVFVARLPAMNLKAVYGPLAFAVALILWAYVSSLMLVFGALVVSPPGVTSGRRR